MFFPIFDNIRNVLKPISPDRAVQWFNNQYESTITNSNNLFIQFKDGKVSRPTKKGNQLDCFIFVHVVQKIASGVDGSISDQQLLSHDTGVDGVIEALDGYVYSNGADKSRELKWVGVEPQQTIGGFIVTILQFQFIF